MELFKKHFETLTILGGYTAMLIGVCFWLNGKFNEMDKRFADIDRRLVRIETILMMHGMMPKELIATKECDK